MTTNLTKYKSDLDKVLKLGYAMELDLLFRHEAEPSHLEKSQREAAQKIRVCFEDNYQKWYTESHAVIRQLIPDRVVEFEHLYKGDGKRREINGITYSIQDWLNGMRAGTNRHTSEKLFDDFAGITMRFRTQLAILQTVEARFESSLFDMKQLVQADLFDSELDATRELVKRGFLRGAGAVAGVVLEKHLAQVAANHNVSMRKQHPAISDLNDALKNANVLDIPAWRSIQRLGDLRNLADHSKHRDPTAEEISDGVDKIAKTLF